MIFGSESVVQEAAKKNWFPEDCKLHNKRLEEYEYLLLYIYMKIHKANDLLFSNKHFESVNHNFKSFINNEIVDIKKLVLENVKNVDLLITMLNR